jgi:hypothetical protein
MLRAARPGREGITMRNESRLVRPEFARPDSMQPATARLEPSGPSARRGIDRAASRRSGARTLSRVVRSLLGATGLALATLAPLAPLDEVPGLARISFVSTAGAQSSRDVVANAIGMKRFDRLCAYYLAPTESELELLDRLHEAYLDRFRAEIEPQIEAVMKTMGGGMPSKSEFERFLRELDTLNTRIAEADNAFLNAVSESLAEDRRAGVARLRDARERQRLLSGLGRFAPMMFGGGGSFVDLSDLVVQPRVLATVPADRREQFGAVLVGMEQRLTAQARAYNARMREGMMKFFDAASSMQSAAQPVEGESPEQAMARAEAMQKAYADAIGEVGGEFRKAVRANFDANRDTLQQLAGILPDETLYDLRARLALKSVGMMGMGLAMGPGGDPATSIARIASRVRRDSTITDEARAQVDAILRDWRRSNAESLEAVASAVANNTGMRMFGGGDDTPEMQALTAAMAKRTAAEQDALSRLEAALGEANGIIARREVPSDGVSAPEEQFVIAPEPDSATASAGAGPGGEIPAAELPGLDAGTAQPLEARTVASAFRVLGTEPGEGDVVDAIVESWRQNDWTPVVEPIQRALASAGGRVYSAGADGEVVYDDAAVKEVEQARAQLATATFEADAKLATNLAGALGLAADDPSLLLLRLERLSLLAGRGTGGGTTYPKSILRLLQDAELDPATAKALVESARPGLTSLADEIPALAKAVLERGRAVTEAERGFSTRDPARVRESSAAYSRLLQEGAVANAALGKRIAEVYDAACVAAISDADLARAAQRARMRAMNPEIFRVSSSAERQLAAAKRLPGLDDDKRAKLEALAAEYDALYLKLSEQMIVPAIDAFPGDGSQEAWQEFARKQAEAQKIGFQRKQLTDKTLLRLRRMLGAELAARVPGLLPDDTDIEVPQEPAGFFPQDED